MEIDAATAARLGFPKLKYAFVERERRWLCASVPMAMVIRSEVFVDLYVTGTRLRLREAVPVGGGAPMRRLARKVDADPGTRLITSIYLSEAEFALLSALPGSRLRKTRHYLRSPPGIALSIDCFEGPLAGLILAEAEFDDDAAMAAFATPDFAIRDVTDDPRYTGGTLVRDGLPR